jgi:hypothetical protein
MFRKAKFVTLLALIVIMLPIQAFASGLSRQYNPPSDSDYYQQKISYQLYFSFGTVKVRMTQYKPELPMTEENKITTVTWNVKENSFMWVDMQCKGALSFEYLDSAGTVVDFHTRGETTEYLNQGKCTAGDAVKPSDFNEEANQYKSDTFGETKSPLTTPTTADGSGGTGSTGFDGVDPGTGGGTTTDPADCPECAVLNCPQWDEYMGKVDEIISKIPPVPNWDEIAKNFRDTIAPQIKKDLQDVLGSAPAPSSPQVPGVPAQLDDLNDRGITAPTGNEAPGLGDSTFDENAIKNGAEVIQERQDPTGGFTINDPLGGLPSQEEFEKNLPTPETGEAPNPPEKDIPAPADPTEGDNHAPNPTEGDNHAPNPTEGDNHAPNPTEGDNQAPTPGGTSGDFDTAPIPGDNGGTAPIPNESGTAPIPDPTNETAPIPGNR